MTLLLLLLLLLGFVSSQVIPVYSCWFLTYSNQQRVTNIVFGYTNGGTSRSIPVGPANLIESDGQVSDNVSFFLSGSHPFVLVSRGATILTWSLDGSELLVDASTDFTAPQMCYNKYDATCPGSGIESASLISGFCDNGLYCDGSEFCNSQQICVTNTSSLPCPGQNCNENNLTCSTLSPTQAPSSAPSPAPSNSPTSSPSSTPSSLPTFSPSNFPTSEPTPFPSESPAPSNMPTFAPSKSPTGTPSESPTPAPSNTPTFAPSKSPTGTPSESPTPVPSDTPTSAPSNSPTPVPSSSSPSKAPTFGPTPSPSSSPSKSPTGMPSKSPTSSSTPTESPTKKPKPTKRPTHPHKHLPTFEPPSALIPIIGSPIDFTLDIPEEPSTNMGVLIFTPIFIGIVILVILIFVAVALNRQSTRRR